MAASQAERFLEQAREGAKPVRLVTGHFDPLVAAHAARMETLAPAGGLLFAGVSDPADPLLPPRARAELVAALRVVDYVVLAEDAGFSRFRDGFASGEVFHEEAADEALKLDLIAHVRRRHASS